MLTKLGITEGEKKGYTLCFKEFQIFMNSKTTGDTLCCLPHPFYHIWIPAPIFLKI